MTVPTTTLLLSQGSHIHRLLGAESHSLNLCIHQRIAELQTHLDRYGVPRIFLIEANPTRFIAGFMAACSLECPLFLCNPAWGQQEWEQVYALAQPDLIWGDPDFLLPTPTPGAKGPPDQERILAQTEGKRDRPPWIMIPTGGSSGQVRFVIHTWSTLMAAVQGFQRYFSSQGANQPIHSCCVLPLYHVSGLMQFLRAWSSSGQILTLPFKTLEQGTLPDIPPETFFISLVPTQLQRLLQQRDRTTWLTRFHTVLLGGAPAWPQLLAEAKQAHIRLALTYGMTETAAQVATLKPDDFLAGNTSNGQVLPHAHITIQDSAGHSLPRHQVGQIVIRSPSLGLGYYPDVWAQDHWATDDLGYVNELGDLHVVGRMSRKMITGGENVFPEEVEKAIWATSLVSDIYVTSLPDPTWGERVTALYVPADPQVSPGQLQAALQGKLSRYKQPKQWLAVEQLPRNAQGKLNSAQLQAILRDGQRPAFGNRRMDHRD